MDQQAAGSKTVKTFSYGSKTAIIGIWLMIKTIFLTDT
jgi:hypothetical protein